MLLAVRRVSDTCLQVGWQDIDGGPHSRRLPLPRWSPPSRARARRSSRSSEHRHGHVHRADGRGPDRHRTPASCPGPRRDEAGTGTRSTPVHGRGGLPGSLEAEHTACLARAGPRSRATVYNYDVVLNGVAVEADRRPRRPGSRHTRRRAARLEEPDRQDRHRLDAGLPRPDGQGRLAEAVRRRRRTPARASSSATSTPASGRRARASPPLPEPRPDAAIIATKWHGTCDRRRAEPGNRGHLQQQGDRRAVLRRRRASATRSRTSSSRRATATATARTPPAPPPATTACPVTSTASASATPRGMAPAARLAVYKIVLASSRTAPRSGATPTSSPRSTTRSPTAST